MRSRHTSITALAAACLLALTGCASTITGSGTGSGAPLTSSAPPISPSAPPTSRGPTQPSQPPSTDTSTPPSGCAGNFCDDFSSSTSGWDTGNETHFYSRYSSYLGGTFEMGERRDRVLVVPAPYHLTDASTDFGARLDVDLTPGTTSPQASIYGASCWNHTAKNGAISAFLFYVTAGSAQIVLWDDKDGTSHVLRRQSWSGVLRPAPARNQLRVLCAVRHLDGKREAELAMSMNGHVVSELYTASAKHARWATAERVGLIVGLPKSQVFYDNVVVTAG